MRPKGMNKLAMPLFALTAATMIGGCAAQSGSTASPPATTAPATAPAATAPAAATSEGGPISSGPSVSAPGSAPAATSAGGATGSAPTSAPALVPAGAISATLIYVGPTSAKPLHATKTVTGATYQRLVADLNALKPDAAFEQCMVLTGETASVTVTSGGHTAVFTIPGSPCRGVSVTEDGAPMPRLTGTMTLVNQVRAIAGFTGMAHPLTG
jgi:hypothetical protein